MTIMIPDGAEQERAKFAEFWSDEAYRNLGGHPGLENVDRFWRTIEPTQGEDICDFGCGKGEAGLEFQRRGLDVTWLDITDAALLPEVPRDKFIQTPIWKIEDQFEPDAFAIDYAFDYGFCCGVLEHIPAELAMVSVFQMRRCCGKVWLDIGFNGSETKKPYKWWLVRLNEVCDVLDARDRCDSGVFIVM